MLFQKRFFYLAVTALALFFMMPATWALSDDLMGGVIRNSVMRFSSGAGEPGFSFTNWNSDNNTIWPANLANPARITSTSGAFTLVSFQSRKYQSAKAADTFTIKSNLGHSQTWVPSSNFETIELNWEGVTWIEVYRPQGGSNPSPDFDNLAYRMNEE